MKFMRDNSEIALTKEYKEQLEREKREAEEKLQKEREEVERLKNEFSGLQRKYDAIMQNLTKRQFEYMPIDYQLDLLWHDMNRGVIKVDRKRKDTWYNHVKEVKEKNPLKAEWREELAEIQVEMHELVSNNTIEDL